MSIATEEKPEFKTRPVTLAELQARNYTERVEVNPNYDTSAPVPPISEATFNAVGEETGKILYTAILAPPPENAVKFNGQPRPFIEDISGTRKDGTKYTAFKLNFDVKITGFADPNLDQSVLIGKGGKFHEEEATTFMRNQGSQDAFSEISDLARVLGLFDGVTLEGDSKTLGVDQKELLVAVAKTIADGQAKMGVTITWKGNYDKTNKKRPFSINGQAKFPFDKETGTHSPVTANGGKVIVKIATYEKLV